MVILEPFILLLRLSGFTREQMILPSELKFEQQKFHLKIEKMKTKNNRRILPRFYEYYQNQNAKK